MHEVVMKKLAGPVPEDSEKSAQSAWSMFAPLCPGMPPKASATYSPARARIDCEGAAGTEPAA